MNCEILGQCRLTSNWTTKMDFLSTKICGPVKTIRHAAKAHYTAPEIFAKMFNDFHSRMQVEAYGEEERNDSSFRDVLSRFMTSKDIDILCTSRVPPLTVDFNVTPTYAFIDMERENLKKLSRFLRNNEGRDSASVIIPALNLGIGSEEDRSRGCDFKEVVHAVLKNKLTVKVCIRDVHKQVVDVRTVARCVDTDKRSEHHLQNQVSAMRKKIDGLHETLSMLDSDSEQERLLNRMTELLRKLKE